MLLRGPVPWRISRPIPAAGSWTAAFALVGGDTHAAFDANVLAARAAAATLGY